MATSSLLALGGTTVLGLLGKRLRDGSLNASSLPEFLQKESAALRAYLPAGFSSVAAASPIIAQKIDVDPVVAQSVQVEKRRSIWAWLLPLQLAALLVGWWALPAPAGRSCNTGAGYPYRYAHDQLGERDRSRSAGRYEGL